MEKRVVFRSRWLPYALVAPQLAITIVFFFWPASQAIVQSVQQQDPFGITVEYVGLDNFVALINDPHYLKSFQVTAVFSVLVTFFGMTSCTRIPRAGGGRCTASLDSIPATPGPSAATVTRYFARTTR